MIVAWIIHDLSPVACSKHPKQSTFHVLEPVSTATVTTAFPDQLLG